MDSGMDNGGDSSVDLAGSPEEISALLAEPQIHGSFNAADIRALAAEHPDFLGALAMPDIHEAGYPPLFLTIWGILTGYASQLVGLFKYFALGLPRGFGKTSFIKLLILWILLFSKRKFILIVAETHQKACNIMADIFDMLDEPNIKKAFGDWRVGKETDTRDLKKFGFRDRTIVVAALGCGGSVRGLNIKNVRPDVILLDDIQSKEDSYSDIESRKIEKWLQGTLLKAKANYGVLVIFLANMYPNDNSLLKKLKRNPEWEKVICGGIITGKDGQLESLWEAVRPLESLFQEYRLDLAAGQEDEFFAEVLNDENASMNHMVDINRIPGLPFDDPDSEIHQGSFIVIDPATGKKNSDSVAIGYFQVFDSRPVMWDLEAARFNPMETIKQALSFCSLYGCRVIFVESVAYQATLKFWMDYFIAKLGIEGIEVVEIYPGRSSKNSRILTMFKQLTGRPDSADPTVPEILLHDRVRTRVISELRGFDPLRTDNVDNILDLLTYATPILTKYGEYLRYTTPIEAQVVEQESVESLAYESFQNSPF